MSHTEDSQSNWQNSAKISSESLETNTKILGYRYRVIKELESEGFNKTYMAEDRDIISSPCCLIKEIPLQENSRVHWQEIIDIQNKLSLHPRIPQVLNYFEEESHFYVVLEYLEGEKLSERLQTKKFSEHELIEFLQDILEVLHFIHSSHVIHGKIQPSNLIKTSNNQRFTIYDFSSVTVINEGELETQNLYTNTISNSTESFSAPEQISGNPIFSSDLYSLGKTAIYSLTGGLVLNPENTILDIEGIKVNSQLKKILVRMSDLNVPRRYNSALEAIKDLNEISPNTNSSHLTNSDLTLTNVGRRATKLRQDTFAYKLIKRSDLLKIITGIIGLMVVIEFLFPRLRPLYYLHQGNRSLPEKSQTALDNFQKALDLRSQYAPAWVGRGNALYNLERYSPALIAYDRAIQINSGSEKAWEGRGDSLYRLERFEAALTAYNRALSMNPDNADGLNRKGRALYKLERYQEALDAQDASLKIKPDYARALSDRGVVLIGLGKYSEAVKSFDRAQAIEPLNPEFWQNKALAWQYLGRSQEAFRLYQEALEAYNTLLQDNPRDVAAIIDKGNVLTKLQQYDKALRSYEVALAINPDSQLAWLNKGNVLFALNQYQRALEAFDRALKLAPESYITWHNRGSLLRDGIKDYTEAIASYNKAIELNPTFYHAWRDQGFAFSQSGQQYLALESFQTALDLKTDDYKSWIGRGIALSELNRINEAVAAFEKAETLQPKDPFVWINKASALEEAKRYSEACDAYNQAKILNPSFTPAISAMARLNCQIK